MAQSSTEAGFDKEPASFKRHVEQPTFLNADIREDDFAQFFTQSIDLLCIAGLDDGYFKRLNPAWTTSLGWSIKDLLGKPFVDFVHVDDRERTLAEVATLVDGKPAILFENRYRHADGCYRWLQWNARSRPSQHRIYATARDVTRRKRLEREVLEAVDRERERLGREMHDGLCQTLAGVAALSASLARKLAASGRSIGSARAAEINKLLKDTIGDARDMARGLDPIGRDAAGLVGALETHAVNVQHLFGVACHAACDQGPARLHREVEIQLFRIAQEAVNNAIVHGRAGLIDISLNCEDHAGILSVKDNGIGLPQDAFQSNGMGLRTMVYRARLINATLKVRRREAGGTAVTCIYPLP